MTIPTTANVTQPKGRGYGAKLTYGGGANDNLYLRLAVGPETPIREQTEELEERNLVSTARSALDISTRRGRLWSMSDFSGGGGLDRAHRPEPGPNDDIRYWDTFGDEGINILPRVARGAPSFITAAPAATSILTLTGSNPGAVFAAFNGSLFAPKGSSPWLQRTDDPEAASPSWVDDDPDAGEAWGSPPSLNGLASFGDYLYLADSDGGGIHRRDTGGTWTHWSDLMATGIWKAKNRIIAAVDNVLYEAAAAAGSTTIKTLDAGLTWEQVTDIPGAIVASASDGTLYVFTDVTGTLTEQAQTQFQEPEAINFVVSFGANLIIGTREDIIAGGKIGRVYLAQVTDGWAIQVERLLWERGADATTTVNHDPHLGAAHGDSVWFVAQENTPDQGLRSYLWRIYMPTLGTSRYMALPIVGSTAFWRTYRPLWIDDRYFAFMAADLFREDTTSPVANTGSIILPMADMFSADTKLWTDFSLEAGTGNVNDVVEMFTSTDPGALNDPGHASWTSRAATTGAPTSRELILPVVTFGSVEEGRYLLIKVEITGVTAELYSVSARAYHKREEARFQIPVNVGDSHRRFGKARVRVRNRGQALLDTLRAYEGERVELEMLLPPTETIVGILERVRTDVIDQPERGSTSHVAYLEIVGVRS